MSLKHSIIISFLIAVSYGIIIEILQGVLTVNRKAELLDAILNSLGSLTAAVVVALNKKRLNFLK